MAILAATLDLSTAATYQWNSGTTWRSERCGQGYRRVHESEEPVLDTEFFEDTILYASYFGYDTDGPTF